MSQLRPSGGCSEFRTLAKHNRRAILRVGALGALGLPLWLRNWSGDALQAAPVAGDTAFGRARRCIFIFAWGGPSQLDTFDMKPDAPAEIRSTFQPVATRVPGWRICEHFSRLAQWTDRVALIRTLSHSDPAHLSSAHATVTGHLAPVFPSDDTPPSDRDTPHLGSFVSRVRPATNGLPSFVMMPWQAYHPAAPGGIAPGQHGGWLGQAYDPLLLTGDPSQADWRAPALQLLDGISPDRLQDRYSMLQLLDRERTRLLQAADQAGWTGFQQRTVDLLSSPGVAQAFDLTRESVATRDRYGRNIHGQCVLLARRLVEHGVPLVTVNWHNDGKAFWDTHGNNFNRLQNDLIPPADQALVALLEDLERTGLLAETLVAWVGEFGRRPQITAANAGREHWPHCYSGLLAGGGIRGGTVYGVSDRHAAYPESDPVSPQDYAATILHALGIDINAVLFDRENRPHRIGDGQPIRALF